MHKNAALPDYTGAIARALDMLRTQLPSVFTYHYAEHTELDVIPAVVRLAQLSGVAPRACLQLQVAAAYHDIGYIRSMVDHEATGITILSEQLPQFGFRAEEIAQIAALLMATRMPQSPQNTLEALLADADLDSLGREDFLQTSRALWLEQKALGNATSWHEWLRLQLQFLQTHRYFTPAAKTLRDAGKQRNITLLVEAIRNEPNDST